MGKPILGQSKPVKDMIKLIERVGPTKTNVLIIGESGTGKELVARMIHDSGPLKGKPFIPVNCGAISENLIESEMFGHKKGSFTGAIADKIGLFEAANDGTLFLDEIGELPLSMQVKLLRAIQDRMIRKVGGNDSIKVEVRLIAATNRDLELACKEGKFREDLYYRLNVILIKTPPLRDRKEDIRMLAETFIERFASSQGKAALKLNDAAYDVIMNYAWPGNIRELENVVQRLVTLQTGTEIGLDHFPPLMLHPQEGLGPQTIELPDLRKGGISLPLLLKDVERRAIDQALKVTGGDKKKAAALLGVTDLTGAPPKK